MLGLLCDTDEAWIDAALADVDALLIDHAHCEMKAASNAMSLAVRYGDRPALVTAMIALAEEELSHLRLVHDKLVARGRVMGAPPVDPYAAMLRKAVGPSRSPTLVERLLIGALIEARSCERFKILSERCPDAELSRFYRELLAAEAGHYRTFVDLAIAAGAHDGIDEASVRDQLSKLSVHEAEIVRGLGRAPSASRAAIHG